jgi:hypothetical protein
MALNELARSLINENIDFAIKDIPRMILLFRQPEMKSEIQYKDETDFILGLMWGRTTMIFSTNFKYIFKRKLTAEEEDEVNMILLKRIRELRKAIFSIG